MGEPAPVSFPRQHARTRRFSLGVPRAAVPGVSPDGPVVLFLRTDRGDDATTHLWRHDPVTGTTVKLVDAHELGDERDVPPEERARRERAREQAGGIVGFAVDDDLRRATFALAGRVWTVETATGHAVEHPTAGPAFDPRLSPDGRRVAYHADGGLHVIDLPLDASAPGTTRPVVTEPGVTWGRAEFVAAEEMGRGRGYWWALDGTLAVTRVDESAVTRWTIADPANPAHDPVTHAYPAAGTANADVSLWVVDPEDGSRTEVRWDRTRDEYLAHVAWGRGPLTLLVQPRDQRTARVLTADPTSGATSLVRAWSDDAWVELVPGSPRWAGDRLLTVEDHSELGPGGTRALCLDGTPLTPPELQVRELVDVDERAGTATVHASPPGDPTSVAVHEVDLDVAVAPAVRRRGEQRPGLRRVVPGRPPGPAAAPGIEPPTVGWVATMDDAAPRVTVTWTADEPERPLEVVAERPVLAARPRMLELGQRRLRAAMFLPSDDDGTSPLPVLLDPYGGPHAQRVVQAQAAHLTSQWLADQGFAVLVVDGRGSPGRGPAWERAVHRDLATPVLEDQVDALHAAVVLEPRLDPSRVAMRGWSFGGYLAAMAVLRRPDVFHAAIAGAPVTDWCLYDTHYTERYLGHPGRDPAAYRVSSLVDEDGRLLGAAPWDPARPPALLLIHGLADDNVVAAHTLRLSSALLADGRPHRFLPLSGVTHMTPQEVVAEHLLTHQVAFLREALDR